MATKDEFKLVSNFTGYVTKKDPTNTSIRNLVAGSQNMLINDAEKVEVRGGYSLFGAADSSGNKIESSFDWNTSTGPERNLRSADDELQVYLGTIDGVAVNAWTAIQDGYSAVDFQYTTFWDTTEAIDLLLFVNGESNINSWSGAVTTLASTTTDTLTKNSSETWGESRFLTSGTRSVEINGTTYTYTGGEGTTTLTGVTPDPSGEAANSVVIQTPTVTANSAITGLPNAFKNDLIAELTNQIYVGSLTSREVYVSQVNDFTDFSFTATRLVGEGALITLSNATVGFATQEDTMYMTAGKDDWYQVNFTLSSDNTAETLTIQPLKTGPQQAAQTQNLISKIKNDVVFVSNEPTLDTLGRVAQQIITPQTRDLSDPIKPDFDAADFTDGDVIYFRDSIYIAAPNDSKVFVYDIRRGYWQPPQVLPAQRFAIISGDLHIHSNTTTETYKLFDTNTDNGNPVAYNATFAYRNFNDRASLKNFDEYFSELYMTPNTKINLHIKYDYEGASGEQQFELDGSNSTFTFGASADNSLGKNSLGKEPLGSTVTALSDRNKFRKINTMRATDFYEMQISYSTTEDAADFEILAHGPNARMAPSGNFAIKE